jgi:YgiT-type zinc finger domain-containing protein
MKRKAKRNRCPTCGKGTLAPKLVNRVWKAKAGGSVMVRGVLVWACDTCEEQAIDYEEVDRAERIAELLGGRKRAAVG